MPLTTAELSQPLAALNPHLGQNPRCGLLTVSTTVFAAGLALLLGILGVWGALVASAESVSDLRGDIPTETAVRTELVDLAGEEILLRSGLNATRAEFTDTLLARETLDDDQRALAAEIEAAAENLRRLAIESYITGVDSGNLEFISGVGKASDLIWRRYLVRSHAGSSTVAVERLRRLRASASEEVLDTIRITDELKLKIFDLEFQLQQIEVRTNEAHAILPVAEAWDRTAIAIEEGAYGIAPADKWEKLRFCESTDNYEAINPSGAYRGAYQFDIATWYTVGGKGDPAQAPPEEQDARARELYARRGHQPWPECGRHLK